MVLQVLVAVGVVSCVVLTLAVVGAGIAQEDTLEEDVLVREDERVRIVLGDLVGQEGDVNTSVALSREVQVLVLEVGKLSVKAQQGFKMIPRQLLVRAVSCPHREANFPG